MTLKPRTEFAWDWLHMMGSPFFPIIYDVRPGQGVLHTVVINQSTNKGNLQLWDGDETIAIILPDFAQPKTLIYDLEFHTMLIFRVFLGWDVTVSYK